jgi:hypothetical protein
LGPGPDDFLDPGYVGAEPEVQRAVGRQLVGVGLAVFGAIFAALGFAVWPSLGFQASTLVILVGGGVTVAAMRRPLPPESARRRWQQWLPWLCLGLAVALWELALLLLGNNDSWPPLSLLAAPIDTLGVGRFSLALLWLAAGAWLIRRPRR